MNAISPLSNEWFNSFKEELINQSIETPMCYGKIWQIIHLIYFTIERKWDYSTENWNNRWIRWSVELIIPNNKVCQRRRERTFPVTPAPRLFCIFMASITHTSMPSETRSPTFTANDFTKPGMGAKLPRRMQHSSPLFQMNIFILSLDWNVR